MSEQWQIREYRVSDRAGVRHVCCETGFLGQPVDPIFEDRELFADFQTSYYLAREPGNVLVAEMDGSVVGYILLCTDEKAYARFLARQLPGLLLRALGNVCRGRYNKATRKYIGWFVTKGWREVPRRPDGAAHFHVNALPEARLHRLGRRLADRMEVMAAARGVRKIYGQMTISPGKRGAAMFERIGWRITDTKPVSKFRQYVNRDCLLATVEKDL